ncbi:MAG: transcription elongation factor GreA [Nitrospinae bacterium]|nr:transcription elongation factor GreA [Nitrospinota bacterium]
MNYLLRATKEKLAERFKEIQKEKTEVANEIRVAKAHGDLKENAEYHSAMEKQGNIQLEESKVLAFLSNSTIIEELDYEGDDAVRVGKKVTLLNVDTDEEVEYQILGEYEADPKQNILSAYAPLARLMMGKEEGDTFRVAIPRKPSIEYEIIEVKKIFS